MRAKYDVILADPPWQFECWDGPRLQRRTAESHYPTMTLEDICDLPVFKMVNDNAALFLWAVWPRIFDARLVIQAWGFEYKTLAWEWVKLNPSGIGFHMGMGHYTRANPEPCLLAVKGSMPVATKGERNLLITPVREHSQKPNEQYAKVDRLYPDTHRLELFARRKWDGWDVWGNEVESTVQVA